MRPRRATEADVDLLVALNGRVHDLHVAHTPEVYRTPDPGEVGGWFREQLASETREVWLLGDLGYLVIELHDRAQTPFSHRRRVLRVDQISVRGDRRRSGVGRALMELAQQRATELGCSRVVLDVADFNEGALAFYAALGFRPVFHRLTRST
jgi:GNAT superfamily N-acetyltransferase